MRRRTRAFALIVGMLILPLKVAHALSFGIFESVELRAPEGAVIPQWERVKSRIADERPIWEACFADASRCDEPGLAEWRELVHEAADRPLAEQLALVNTFANRVRYVSDQRNWGQSDYWADPLEFLQGAGDCEDYAIFKYITLRELGVPATALRIVVLEDTSRGIAHAVLAVDAGGRREILDNLDDRILADNEIDHYVPYYSINEDGRWSHIEDADGSLRRAAGLMS